jgi:hypothetical protein
MVGRHGYAIVYGSHARGTARSRSDLDVLAVGPDPIDTAGHDRLISGVKRLHHRHGLDLDEEVSYAVKLYATFSDVAAAVGFTGFAVSPAGELAIPAVVASPEFLNSTPFKLRLIVNALTSPNVFLDGNPDRFAEDTVRACRALVLLALSILADHDVVTVPQAVDVLVTDPRNGSTGQDYLGYTAIDAPTVYGLVRLGFAHFICKDALRPIDGARFAQCPNVRRSLVLTAAVRSGCPPVGIPKVVE